VMSEMSVVVDSLRVNVDMVVLFSSVELKGISMEDETTCSRRVSSSCCPIGTVYDWMYQRYQIR
jgi:hypothetical protein